MLPPSPEISPATTAAMILAHQSAKIIDYEAVQRLTSQKQVLQRNNEMLVNKFHQPEVYLVSGWFLNN